MDVTVGYWKRQIKYLLDNETVQTVGKLVEAAEELVKALDKNDCGDFVVEEFYVPYGMVSAVGERMMKRKVAFVRSSTNKTRLEAGAVGRLYFDSIALDELERAEEKELDDATESIPASIDQEQHSDVPRRDINKER